MAETKSGFDELSPVVKLLLALIIFVAIAAGLYFFLYEPTSTELDQAKVKEGELQQEYAAVQQRVKDYRLCTEELSRREKIDRENKKILPEKAEIPSFLQDLNRLAELSGLGITLVEPKPSEPGPQYSKIPVALSLEGKYHQLAKFFFNVSRIERAISMEDISLKPQKNGGAPGSDDQEEGIDLKVSVLATTFHQPPPPPKPVAPAGAVAAQGVAQ